MQERSKRDSQSLSSKYLLLSLLVALVPLISFAFLYDSYFSRLVTQLTDEQLATRLAATKNEIRVFLRERSYELEALSDQFDDPAIFERSGRTQLSNGLEDLLRLQTDPGSVYGVAFFTGQGELAWTFPQGVMTTAELAFTEFEGLELAGPSPHSWQRPAWLLMKKRVEFHGGGEQMPSIGLIIRFNSITETLRGLNQAGAYEPVLSVGYDEHYDVTGQPVVLRESSYRQMLFSDWALHLVQNKQLVSSPIEKMRVWLILLVIGTVTGLLFLHVSVSRRLNQQIDALVSSVERVAAGDLESPASETHNAEMSRLAQAIERMRQQLKQFISSTVEIERRASLGQLAAGLAHDIRNPLTIIRTTIVALIKREKDPESREMLVMLEDEIDRANEVIDNLLNFARPRDPSAEALECRDLLENIIALTNAAARERGVDLQLMCPEGIWMWADSGQIRQILMNLILNAIQAMSVHGGELQISCAKSGKWINLQLSDNGPGIPQDVLPHITEPFFTTKSVGTGLGLAICQALTKKNDGELLLESTHGIGTTVILKLPTTPEVNHYA